MPLPSVFAYLDYRAFLRDWIDARRQADSAYSYSAFAAAGGCSKSALANVISGARSPRAGTLDAFARAMDLPPSGRNYLGLLVELSIAQDLDRRREVMERILASERFHQVRVAEGERDSTVFRYLEHWYVPAVRELAGLPGFREDPEWIVRTLTPRITLDEARDALDRLFELGFLRRDPSGAVQPCEVQFRTDPEAAQDAALHFHREVIAGLLARLERRLPQEQHVVAATLTLPPSLVPEVKERLNAVVNQLAALADASGTGGERRVFQVAVQLLPLSEVVE